MKKINLYNVYSHYSNKLLEFNNIEPNDKILNEREFNSEISKSNFSIRYFSVEKKANFLEEISELEEIIDETAEETNESEDTEKSGSSAKKDSFIELALVFCKAEIFSKVDYYKKINSALKNRSKLEKEVIIIYENDSKVTGIKSTLSNLEKNGYYARSLSISSLRAFPHHMFSPIEAKILNISERESMKNLFIETTKIPTISWLDPLVVFLRARIGDVLSINDNSLNSGLHHTYRLVTFD